MVAGEVRRHYARGKEVEEIIERVGLAESHRRARRRAADRSGAIGRDRARACHPPARAVARRARIRSRRTGIRPTRRAPAFAGGRRHGGPAGRARRATRHGGVRPHPRARLRANHLGWRRTCRPHRRGRPRRVPRQQPRGETRDGIAPADAPLLELRGVQRRVRTHRSRARHRPRRAIGQCRRHPRTERRGEVDDAEGRVRLVAADRGRRVRRGPARERRHARRARARGLVPGPRRARASSRT